MASELADLKTKVDLMLAKEDLFTPAEALALRSMVVAYQSVRGFVTVTKKVGIVIAFVVLFWTQWDRLMELVRGRP